MSCASIYLHSEKVGVEIGLTEINGICRNHAVFLCKKSQFNIMLDWVRQLKDWLGSLIPVDQPCSVRLHVWSHVVGFKTLSTESAMLSNTTPKTKVSVFYVVDKDNKIIASDLPFHKAYEKAFSTGSRIKFQLLVEVQS